MADVEKDHIENVVKKWLKDLSVLISINQMVNYVFGKIYKLVNNVDDKIYIGSTCTTLARRKSDHKASSKKKPNRPVYQHVNAIGWDNVEIILIEAFACNNKMELEKRERYYIDSLKPELNKNIPTRTNQEYRETNKAIKSAHEKTDEYKAYRRAYQSTPEYLAKKREWRRLAKQKQ
jgi:group I intron endonuclease